MLATLSHTQLHTHLSQGLSCNTLPTATLEKARAATTSPKGGPQGAAQGAVYGVSVIPTLPSVGAAGWPRQLLGG